MHKRLILVFLLIIFFYSSRVAFAALFINEIMYDLPGSDSVNSKSREWIEVYNSGSSDIPIDASKWRIYDGSANKTINGEVDFSIPALSYVIFSGNKDTFLSDYSNFTGLVYDTGITSLNNSGATLKILDQDGVVVDAVTYASSQGASGDGNSLQKISDSWISSTPTPGTVNTSLQLSSSSSNSTSTATGALTNNNTSSTTTDSNNLSKSKIAEDSKINTKITMKTLAFVGAPIILQATTTGYSKEQLHFGKYFWNFGDGDSKEILVNSTDKITHTYFYPGDYTVSLEYYANPYSDIRDAIDTLIVKVVPEDLVISKVGDEKDFFVEISNNMNNEADVSGWVLLGGFNNFVFPRNTVLGSKKKMILSPKITHFSFADKDTLRLLTKEGDIVFDYFASLNPPTPTVSVLNKQEKVSMGIVPTKEENVGYLKINPFQDSFGQNLEATAVNSDVLKDNPVLPSGSSAPVFIFLLFVGGGATSIYFIRRKKISPLSGDDFEILN